MGARDWQLGGGRSITLDQPRVVAILNVTPDSFYSQSRVRSAAALADAARRAVAEGADMFDVGAESTRPGAGSVPEQEQIARLSETVPVIVGQGVPVSVDTTRRKVAEAALDLGAHCINDVSAGLDDADMFALAAERGCGLILMHRLREPAADRYSDRYGEHAPAYADVVLEVKEFLRDRAALAMKAGVDRRSIVIDPGLGFGKTVEQNLELIRRTSELVELGFPVMSAASRKSFVGRASGLASSGPEDRLAGSIAASLEHRRAGAAIFRVHDVGPQVQALRAAAAIGLSK